MQDQRRGAYHRKRAEEDSDPQGLGRGRDRDRHHHQQGERIFQPPGQIEQRRKLQQVVAEHLRRVSALQPLAGREIGRQHDIGEGGQADDGDACSQGQMKAQAQMHAEHGDGLADHRDPAQPDQRLQP
jgi:hypothetical protein